MTTIHISKLLLIATLIMTSHLAYAQASPIVSDDDDTHSSEEQTSHVISISQRWGFGFLAGFGISLIGFLTALLIVWLKHLASDVCFEMMIKFLFSLAFGALLGDAMIHILPEAYTAEGTDSRVTAGIFIGAILFFLILERIFEACGITHQHWHGKDTHSHDQHEGQSQHHQHDQLNKVCNQTKKKQNPENTIRIIPINSNNIIATNDQISKFDAQKSESKVKKDSLSEDQKLEKKSCWENLKGKGSSGYMNLVGSLIHNFMDGLALGVAFATGDKAVFIPVLIAIIAHQIPRQMGDVAILMKASFNATQTVLCNGFVNLTSLIGVLIGLAITQLSDVTKLYILVFVAGNFIFIAADIWKHLFKNKGFGKNFIEFIGFGIGVAAMYLVLLLESDQQSHQH